VDEGVLWVARLRVGGEPQPPILADPFAPKHAPSVRKAMSPWNIDHRPPCRAKPVRALMLSNINIGEESRKKLQRSCERTATSNAVPGSGVSKYIYLFMPR